MRSADCLLATIAPRSLLIANRDMYQLMMKPQKQMVRLWRVWQVRLLFAVSLLWAGPTLACGSFAPRPTPTPTTLVAQAQPAADATADGQVQLQEVTPTPLPATATPPPEATATFTPTPQPGAALSIGQPARIAAPGGLNMRASAGTGGAIVTYISGSQVVDVIAGPTDADGYTWWQVDDRGGNQGWLAAGDSENEWLSPRLGEAQPVNRSPRVGDRIVVTVEQGQQLSVRSLPTTDGPPASQVNAGTQFTVLAGPQNADGFVWFQIRADDGGIEGWAAEGDSTRRWLSPLE